MDECAYVGPGKVLPATAMIMLGTEALDREIREERERENARLLG